MTFWTEVLFALPTLLSRQNSVSLLTRILTRPSTTSAGSPLYSSFLSPALNKVNHKPLVSLPFRPFCHNLQVIAVCRGERVLSPGRGPAVSLSWWHRNLVSSLADYSVSQLFWGSWLTCWLIASSLGRYISHSVVCRFVGRLKSGRTSSRSARYQCR